MYARITVTPAHARSNPREIPSLDRSAILLTISRGLKKRLINSGLV
jgi:hypothetical protein